MPYRLLLQPVWHNSTGQKSFKNVSGCRAALFLFHQYVQKEDKLIIALPASANNLRLRKLLA
jgi:hypothetical protein